MNEGKANRNAIGSMGLNYLLNIPATSNKQVDYAARYLDDIQGILGRGLYQIMDAAFV